MGSTLDGFSCSPPPLAYTTTNKTKKKKGNFRGHDQTSIGDILPGPFFEYFSQQTTSIRPVVLDLPFGFTGCW